MPLPSFVRTYAELVTASLNLLRAATVGDLLLQPKNKAGNEAYQAWASAVDNAEKEFN